MGEDVFQEVQPHNDQVVLGHDVVLDGRGQAVQEFIGKIHPTEQIEHESADCHRFPGGFGFQRDQLLQRSLRGGAQNFLRPATLLEMRREPHTQGVCIHRGQWQGHGNRVASGQPFRGWTGAIPL